MSGDGGRPGAISIVTTAPLFASPAQSTATALSVAQRLYREGRLGRVICPGFETAGTGIAARHFSVPGRRVQRAMDRLRPSAGRWLPLAQRRLREQLFDLLVSRSAALRESEIVLFMKPVFPRSAARARARGAAVFALASIQHPAQNAARVAEEQARRGLFRPTTYTDRRRVANIEAFLESTDVLLCRAPGSERSYLEHGVPARKIRTIGETGADCETFRPEPAARAAQGFRVLHLSHMNLIKGLGYLFQAWRELALPGAELVLAGPMDEDVRELLAAIDPPNVVRLGPVSDPRPAYQRADVFVSPSISDMGPATVLEAMACGTPVVVSDACGASGILTPGRDGFVYRYDDVGALKGHLRHAFENRERLREMGREARQTALRFSRSDFAERVLRAIDEPRAQPAPEPLR